MYVDEAGINDTEDFPYGYSQKGERCHALKSGKKREVETFCQNVSTWLSAFKEGKLIAPLTFEGSCNRNLFEFWLKYFWLPVLEPGDIIIDNASFRAESLSPKWSKKPDVSCGIFHPILLT